MSIFEYIKENKIIILLFIVAIFIIYFYLFSPANIEKMNGSTIDLVGKDVRLKYQKNGDEYYLGVIDKSQCFNLKNMVDTVCSTNVAVLQKVKTINSSFKVGKLFSKDAYFLTSRDNAKLCHNLNATVNPSPYLCFALGQDMNDTTFTIEKSDTGHILVFTKQISNANGQVSYVPYYISECGVTGLCKFKGDIYLKLCLVAEKENAITFNFVAIEDDNKIFLPNANQEHANQEHPMLRTPLDHISMEHTMESFDNVSNFSLLSQCDTMSLPGPGGMGDYASWDGASI